MLVPVGAVAGAVAGMSYLWSAFAWREVASGYAGFLTPVMPLLAAVVGAALGAATGFAAFRLAVKASRRSAWLGVAITIPIAFGGSVLGWCLVALPFAPIDGTAYDGPDAGFVIGYGTTGAALFALMAACDASRLQRDRLLVMLGSAGGVLTGILSLWTISWPPVPISREALSAAEWLLLQFGAWLPLLAGAAGGVVGAGVGLAVLSTTRLPRAIRLVAIVLLPALALTVVAVVLAAIGIEVRPLPFIAVLGLVVTAAQVPIAIVVTRDRQPIRGTSV